MDRIRPPYRNHGACILRRCRGYPNGGARGGLLRDDVHLHDGGHVGWAADAGGNLRARSGSEDLPATFNGEVRGRIHRDDAHRGAQGVRVCVYVKTGDNFAPFWSRLLCLGSVGLRTGKCCNHGRSCSSIGRVEQRNSSDLGVALFSQPSACYFGADNSRCPQAIRGYPLHDVPCSFKHCC